VYRIVTYDEAAVQIAALPTEGLVVYAQLLDVLQLTPWNGPSINPANPDGAVRLWSFDRGMVTYLILEDQQRVDVIDVVWPG
jgi:hypothetical protein